MGLLLVLRDIGRLTDRAYLGKRESRPEAEADSKSFLTIRAFRRASGYNLVTSFGPSGNAEAGVTGRGDRAMSREDHTTIIQGCIDRLHAGDESARVALLDCAADRLRRLARKMLKDYPGVARWEQGDDVAQNALIRLDRALRAVAPPTAREFFRLAAAQVRRELIDLARHYQGPRGLGANHATRADRGDSANGVAMAAGAPETTYDPGRLAAWAEFHAAVAALGEADRELFDLLWYQGVTQAEAAALLGVTERTINSRWLAARVRLGDSVGGQFPI
jgi:RNA polymerase sigma factor (sigma-70 family)